MRLDEIPEFTVLHQFLRDCVVLFPRSIPDQEPRLSSTRESCNEIGHVKQPSFKKLERFQIYLGGQVQSLSEHLPSHIPSLLQMINVFLEDRKSTRLNSSH